MTRNRSRGSSGWLLLAAFLGLAVLASLWASAEPTTAQPDSPVERARRHLADNSAALGLKPDVSDLRTAGQRRSLTADHVRFQQTLHGVPVFGAQVSVGLPDGEREPIVRSSYVRTGRARTLTGGAGGPAAALASAARSLGLPADAVTETAPAALVYFPSPDKILTPAWSLSLRTSGPPGSWVVLVDANSGEVLYRHNLLRFDSGQVFDPNPAQTNGGVPPAPHCDNGVNAAAMAQEYVSKTLLGITAAQNKLRGPWVDTTAPGIFGGYKPAGQADSASHVYNYGCNVDGFEEVMIYHHLDRTQRKIQALGFSGTSGVLNRPIPAHAHYFAGCNAFFDPVNRGVHFGDFDDVGDCGVPPLYDSAEDADVIVHEYGHAIQDDQVPGWSFGPFPQAEEAGAMGEGFGDFIAGVMNNDACIGEYVSFGLTECGGSPGLRWLQNTMIYPGGYNSCPLVDYDGNTVPESREVHCGGLVWGGALWDLVELIGGGSATQQARDIGLTLVLEAQFYLDQTATFNEAAAAICLADSILYSGAYAGTIAGAFGGRGISSGGCTNTDFPSLFLRIRHGHYGDLDINVKVGANVNSPVCPTINIADPDPGVPYPSPDYLAYIELGPCAGFLPPTAGQPWWLEVRDMADLDIGTIQDFQVLLAGGVRCTSGDPPVAIPDNDPGFVYAKVDCTVQHAPLTPSPLPTPTPGPSAFGNVDCAGGINSIDALKVLRFSASLTVSQTEPCEDIGTPLPNTELQGDVDCSGLVNSIDALKLLRFAAGLSYSQIEPPPCPDIAT